MMDYYVIKSITDHDGNVRHTVKEYQYYDEWSGMIVCSYNKFVVGSPAVLQYILVDDMPVNGWMHTSVVLDIECNGSEIKLHTMNSIYTLDSNVSLDEIREAYKNER